MPPYQISLVRYHGFGVEETDFNDFGPNLEFDGFGLFLWALRSYEVASGDEALAAGRWAEIGEKVGDVLVALVDPETGLLQGRLVDLGDALAGSRAALGVHQHHGGARAVRRGGDRRARRG
jgi:hypothetical protein